VKYEGFTVSILEAVHNYYCVRYLVFLPYTFLLYVVMKIFFASCRFQKGEIFRLNLRGTFRIWRRTIGHFTAQLYKNCSNRSAAKYYFTFYVVAGWAYAPSSRLSIAAIGDGGVGLRTHNA
jgi:hypothetical protein